VLAVAMHSHHHAFSSSSSWRSPLRSLSLLVAFLRCCDHTWDELQIPRSRLLRAAASIMSKTYIKQRRVQPLCSEGARQNEGRKTTSYRNSILVAKRLQTSPRRGSHAGTRAMMGNRSGSMHETSIIATTHSNSRINVVEKGTRAGHGGFLFS
jgi:hypothetical protein